MSSLIESNVLSAVADRRATDLRYRQRQLNSLHRWVGQHITELKHAIRKDDDLREAEAQLVIALALDELRRNYDSLDLKKELEIEYKINKGQDNEGRRLAEELVYVIPENFTAFFGLLSALCTCITAGSCCIIELPSDLRRTPALLQKMINEALDNLAFGVVNNRPGNEFLKKCLVVDQQNSLSSTNAKRLLSSGSRSSAVAIVDRTADVESAVKSIAMSVELYSGRGPYAPNCILVNEFVEKEFARVFETYASCEMKKTLENGHAAQGSQKISETQGSLHRSLTSFRNVHLKRISNREQIVLERHGEVRAPTLLAVTSLDEAIDILDSKAARPLLALYIFAQPKSAKYLGQFIRAEVEFINHIPMNILVGPAAPSGYQVIPTSRYRREMFETFSPQFIRPVPGTIPVHELKVDGSKAATDLLATALQTLKPTGQAREGDVNFFVQGIRVATIVYILPGCIAAASIMAFAVRSLYKQWR